MLVTNVISVPKRVLSWALKESTDLAIWDDCQINQAIWSLRLSWPWPCMHKMSNAKVYAVDATLELCLCMNGITA
jgi:hypothetical protein